MPFYVKVPVTCGYTEGMQVCLRQHMLWLQGPQVIFTARTAHLGDQEKEIKSLQSTVITQNKLLR